MGFAPLHQCQRCGYETHVTGGVGAGMLMHVLTLSCRDCEEVYDAPLLERVFLDSPPGVSRERWKQYKLRCPVDTRHDWEPFNGRCPRCQTELTVDPDSGLLWD